MHEQYTCKNARASTLTARARRKLNHRAAFININRLQKTDAIAKLLTHLLNITALRSLSPPCLFTINFSGYCEPVMLLTWYSSSIELPAEKRPPKRGAAQHLGSVFLAS